MTWIDLPREVLYNLESFAFFLEAVRAFNKNINDYLYFYILYFVHSPTFFVAEIIGLLGKNFSLLFIQNCFKCDYDHYKVLSVIMTITVLLRLATHK